MWHDPAMSVDALLRALNADDADAVRRVLSDDAGLKGQIDDPVAPFDSPPITLVKSRATLDVLLAAGANVNGRSRWWAGGFGLVDSAPPELVRYAIARGAVLTVHAAARLGWLDELQRLVGGDPALVRARGGDGQTPLHFAATVEVARYLLDRGAEINVRDIDHESTPAQYMTGDRVGVARELIARGASTDLLLASAVNDAPLAARLLDSDPETIRTRVDDTWFPKANPHSGGTIYQWTLGFHVSPHEVARRRGHGDVLGVLLDRSPSIVRLIDACLAGDEERAAQIRASQPSPLASMTNGDRQLLAHAARNDHARAVRLMIESGWPIDARGQHGATALHWAAFHGNVEAVEALLSASAPLDAVDRDFSGAPLDWAMHGSEGSWRVSSGDYGRVVDLLLGAGARRPKAIRGTDVVRRALGHG
jgi:hypothetical protein